MQFRLPPMPLSVYEQAEALLMVVGAAILGGLIGTEREWRSKPAGIRTHILLWCLQRLSSFWGRHSLSFIQLALRENDPQRALEHFERHHSWNRFIGAGTVLKNVEAKRY